MSELELQREEVLKKYVLEFDKRTNKGKVFIVIKSDLDMRDDNVRTQLTEDEKEERIKWAEAQAGLKKLYHRKALDRALAELTATDDGSLSDITRKEMLLLRVAPPLLTCRDISQRSTFQAERKRCYPLKIYAWKGFKREVRSFLVTEVEGETETADVLYDSLKLKKNIVNESDEATYLVDHVLVWLQMAGFLIQGCRTEAVDLLKLNTGSLEAESLPQTPPVRGNAARQSRPVLGNADRFLIAGQSSVPIEFKATQNFLVPEKAAEVVRRYNKAVKEVNATKERTVDWVNIGHCVAQLTSYMVDAKSRQGVLSSGTRSYFFKVEEVTNKLPKVFISNAWFIGQKDTLRAWAYVHHLATVNGDFPYPEGLRKKWKAKTPKPKGRRRDTEDRDGGDGGTSQGPSNEGPSDEGPSHEGPSKRRKRDGDDRGGSSKRRKRDGQDRGAGGPPAEQEMAWLDPGVAASIPRVDGDDIQFGPVIGEGNNLVYLAIWNGHHVAVKVFDVYKDFEWFEKEIRAYEHLKGAWGVLVPKPYFIAELCSVVLLGMQLGRVPNSDDKGIKLERDNLFRTLRDEYEFDHLDRDARNVIYLPDNGGTGPDRLVAIDLEAHEIRQQHGSGCQKPEV